MKRFYYIKILLLNLFLLANVLAQQKSVEITSPSSYKPLDVNSKQIITWTSNNVRFVDIEYSLNGQTDWNLLAKKLPAFPSNYEFQLPDYSGNELFLRISDSENPLIFSIRKYKTKKNENSKKTNNYEKVQETNANIRIMLLGNSITEGVVGSTNETGFRRTLDSLLNYYSYSFDFVGSQNTGIPNDFDKDHEGHGGWHADHPNYSRLSIVDSVYTWLVKNPADYVLLHIGTNDLGELEIFNQTSLEQVNDVSAILDSIDKYETDYAVEIPVILARIINRTDNGATSTVNETDTTTAFNLQLQQMAENRISAGDKIIMLNQEAALIYPDDLDDGVHPNDSGYEKMAYKWFVSLNSEFSGCPENMISYWEMNETGVFTNVKDKLGLNNGTCSGSQCPQHENGMNFGAFLFDGIDDEIVVQSHPSINWSNSLNFSVEVWIKTQQNGSGNKVLVGKHDGNPAWWLGFDASTGKAKFSFRSSTGDDYAEVTSSSVVNDGKWHLITGTKDFDNSNIKIYIDGNFENSATAQFNGDFSGSNSLTIGSYLNNYYFNGRMDELRIYDRTITDQEVSNHFNSGILGEGVCTENKFYVDVKVFLEGNYSLGSMTNQLNTNGYIPLEQPYTDSYDGAERVNSIPNSEIVDWILVELRNGITGTSTAKMRAAFLKSDGKIVDLDGVSPVSFSGLNEGNYYLVVHHRNHLSIMSANQISLTNNLTYIYDFTSGIDKYYGTEGAVELGNGVWGMWSGDTDGSGTVDASDRNSTWNNRNKTGYENSDVGLNGVVDAADRNKTWNNRNRTSAVP